MSYLSIIAASRRRFDADAADYFTRIESAGSSISASNKVAVNAFVVGCKDDGIWSAIKASCILAGADTLAGALVPLVGPAPTNNGFVAGDYSRTTGLKGSGTKHLDSNRDNSADPQDSKHISVYITQAQTVNCTFISSKTLNVTGDSYLYKSANGTFNSAKINANGSVPSFSSSAIHTGTFGAARGSSSSITARHGGSSFTIARTSVSPLSGSLLVFTSGPLYSYYSDARISFYSIGENIDLSKLDSRLTTLMASLT